MAEKLRLPKSRRFVYRAHILALLALFVVGVVIGLVLGQQPAITGLIVGKDKATCVPLTEFNYFLGKYNSLQADYKSCVKEAWSLTLALKQGGRIPVKNATVPVPVGNTTK